MTTPEELECLLRSLLDSEPGSTARELLRHLRRAEIVSADLRKRDLNRILYGSSNFQSDGNFVPRWAIRGHEVGRTQRAATTSAVRRRRQELDAISARMSARAPLRPMWETEASELDSIDWSGEWFLPDLWGWQREALSAWFHAGGQGIVEAVTGTGKTHLGLEAACRMASRGGRTTILVPSVELQRQWEERLSEFANHLSLATVGGHSRGVPELADVTVALVQSARTRDLTAGGGRLLLIGDEVHRYGAERWAEALRDGYQYRLGLTATLERSGDEGVDTTLIPYFKRKVFSYAYTRAVPEGVVAPFALAFLGVRLTYDESQRYESLSRKIARARNVLERVGAFVGSPGEVGQRIRGLRGARGEIGAAARDYEDGARIRRNLLAACASKPPAVARLAELIDNSQGTVIFSQTIESAEEAAHVLRQRGVLAAAIHSGMAAEERRANLNGLRDQSLAALSAPKILDEGIDIPNLDLGIVMSASTSRRQMIQRLGRVIRRKPAGRHARFAVLYAEGTVEDPHEGAHEPFLEMVRSVAAQETILPSGWHVESVATALDMPDTWRPALSPGSPMSPKTDAERARPSTVRWSAGQPQPRKQPSIKQRQPIVGETYPGLEAWDPGLAVQVAGGRVPDPMQLAASADEFGAFIMGGHRYWARGWLLAATGIRREPPCDSDVVEWVRSSALEVLADALLESRPLSSESGLTGRIKDRLAATAPVAFDGHDDAVPTVVHRNLGVPIVTRTGASFRKIGIVVCRPGLPDIVIEVDATNSRASASSLELAAQAGAIAIWVRWKSGEVIAVPGVSVVRLTNDILDE